MTIGTDLDAALAAAAASPTPTLPFDASTINAQIAALTAAVAALQAGVPPPPPPPVDHPPVWLAIPPVLFTQGKAGTFSYAGLCSDPDGDPLTFTFSGSLPTGVTHDSANRRFVYDGVGAVGQTSGNFIIADDGRA